jgi:hypothetical protein
MTPPSGRSTLAPSRGDCLIADVINWIATTLQSILHWFQTVAPGGFGLILLPLIALGVITILVSRRS